MLKIANLKTSLSTIPLSGKFVFKEGFTFIFLVVGVSISLPGDDIPLVR
jgi:hypothetical protein